MQRRPDIRLTSFLGKQAPDSLKGLKNARHREQKSWAAYRRFMAKSRFHLALAPYRETPFNRARSCNKILDHAAYGAAGLYSARPPLADYVTNGADGLLLADEPQQWTRAIEELLAAPDEMQRLARAGAQLAQKLGEPARAKAFWLNLLGLDAS